MQKGKVVLVGTGFVGMSMAYSMLNRGGIEELVLIDIDKEKTIGCGSKTRRTNKTRISRGKYKNCKANYTKYNGKWI